MKKKLHEKKISELEFDTEEFVWLFEFDKVTNMTTGKTRKLTKKEIRQDIKRELDHMLSHFKSDCLKQWAIAVVKNCKNPWDERMVGMLGKGDKINTPQFMCGYYHRGYKHKIYCQACERFIDCFELTKEDL